MYTQTDLSTENTSNLLQNFHKIRLDIGLFLQSMSAALCLIPSTMSPLKQVIFISVLSFTLFVALTCLLVPKLSALTTTITCSIRRAIEVSGDLHSLVW